MKQRLLFEGELSDKTLENVFPALISKAIECDEDVFLRWNGATVRIEPQDTVGTLMEKYEKEIGIIALANRKELGKDGRDKHLYRIKNKLGEFYIVACSFDEAADGLSERLRKADWGFYRYRNVPGIDHIAVEHFFGEKQSFSEEDGNLIIVEG